MIETLKNRHEFPLWLNEAGLVGAGAEIGVAAGDYAKVILDKWRGTWYYMVDPWRKQHPSVFTEHCNCNLGNGTWDYEGWFRKCRDMAEKDRRIVLLRMLSHEACLLMLSGSLDWVYIDANHKRDFVMQDIVMWFRTVKEGGVLAGHDYKNPDVRSALDSWNNDRFHVHTTECDSWWIQL